MLGLDTAVWIGALAILVALGVDRWLGEPPVRFHPVVWMGNYLGWAGKQLQRHTRQALRLNPQSDQVFLPDFKAFWLGALAWSAGAATVYVASWWLQRGFLNFPDALKMFAGQGPIGRIWGSMLAALLLGLTLKPLLAWAMLRSEVAAVEKALAPEQGGSLAAGRERLRWLVSRDVTQLTQAQVRESAIETLAENLNDSVVAPIFWFVLLGLPGAALYRFANTADAMWGYRGVYQGRNWEWAGKWAAHADDILSWLPARITGLLLLAMTRATPEARSLRQRVATLRREAARTPSPNSGWPMAAMALVLGISVSKPGVYTLNASGRAPQAQDVLLAQKYASKVVLVHAAWALIAIVFAVISWPLP